VTIGEVCLLTNDVPRLSTFYKQLPGVVNGSNYGFPEELSGK